MKTLGLLAGLTFFSIVCQAQLTDKDKTFVMDAAQAGMFEAKLGALAQTKGASMEVRNLGKMMVDDHTKANNELKMVASRKGLTLPTALDEKHQKMYDDLALERGMDFDKKYSDGMVKGHEKVLADFKKEAEKGDDADIKAFASGKIATLEHHLHMSKKTCESAKK